MDKITRERMTEFFDRNSKAVTDGEFTPDNVLCVAIGCYLQSVELLLTHLGEKVARANYVEELKLARAMTREDQLKFINASLLTEFHKDLL